LRTDAAADGNLRDAHDEFSHQSRMLPRNLRCASFLRRSWQLDHCFRLWVRAPTVDLLGLGKDVPHCRLQLPSFMPALVAPDDWLSRQKRGNANVTPSNFVV